MLGRKRINTMKSKRHCFLLVASTLALCISVFFSAEARGEKWQIYRNHEFGIQFLCLSAPTEYRFDSTDLLKMVWHIGFMNDGTNGAIQATRPKDGSLRGISTFQLASDLRQGMEQSKKSKILSQKNIYSNGIEAIEFRIVTTTKKGEKWHGVIRKLVIGDTLYSIMITSPNKEKLLNQDVAKYLGSLMPISK